MVPRTAVAHEVLGFTGFASQVLHPLASVDLLLGLIAVALLIAADGRTRMLLIGAGMVVMGAALGMAAPASVAAVPGLWRLPLIAALILGGAAAADLRCNPSLAAAAASIVGTIVGLGLVRERPGFAGSVETLAGMAIALSIVVAFVALPIRLAPRKAMQLAVRIAGAWIVAIAILGLAVTR